VGGLLLAEFGRVPEFDEVMTLADRFEFRVIKADNRRIITLEMNVLET
jgi:Mg2+/Co2+ transporter CorC